MNQVAKLKSTLEILNRDIISAENSSETNPGEIESLERERDAVVDLLAEFENIVKYYIPQQ